MPPQPPSRLARVALPLVLLAALAVFGPGIQAGYVFDDQLLVARNQLTGSLANLPAMFSTSLWDTVDGPPNVIHGYYRPLFLASLALDRAVGGDAPWVGHAVSLGWHLLAVVLVAALLRRLVADPLAVVAGTALFAVHPLQVESVQWIAARNDPMAAVFLLGGILVLLGESRLRGPLGGALLLAAALCKESALLAPLLVGLLRWLERAERGLPADLRPACLPALLATLAYAAVRVASGVPLPDPVSVERVLHVLGVATVLYAGRLLWPLHMSPVIHLHWPPPLPWAALVAALALAALLVRLGGRRAVAGLLFAGLSFAPSVAGLASSGLLADRYLYLPMAGLALAVAAALDGRGALLAFPAILGLGTVLSGWLLPQWKDEDALWQAALREAPSPQAAGAYGVVLQGQGRLDEAAHWLHEATLPPIPYPNACRALVPVHLQRGDPATAAIEGERALEAGCRPVPELLAPLSLALALTGRWEQAEQRVSQIQGEDPTGKAVIVRVAIAARRGDDGPFDAAAEGVDPQTRRTMAGQIAGILEQGGEPEAAAALRAHVGG